MVTLGIEVSTTEITTESNGLPVRHTVRRRVAERGETVRARY
jgi:hypothetical protein